jgi:hypothetical protein
VLCGRRRKSAKRPGLSTMSKVAPECAAETGRRKARTLPLRQRLHRSR